MTPSADSFRHAQDFQRFFSGVVHKINPSKRDFGTADGWKHVYEWMSKARLYDRYVIVLRVAIDIAEDGSITELESPRFEIVEVVKVEKGKAEKDGPKYELIWYRSEEGTWEELVENAGDLSSLGFEFKKDSPVKRFEAYWQDTQ